jgi:hypothetical protein
MYLKRQGNCISVMDKKKLTFEAIAIKDDVGYASDYNRNSLFKVDMKTV